jgi:N-acetyltransferase 10
LSIDEAAVRGAQLDTTEVAPLTKPELDQLMSPFDLKRLESYANNMLDYHVVLDLLPIIATLYFTGRIQSNVNMNGPQKCILLGIGLQRKDIDTVAAELNITSGQLLALFIKIMRKATAHFGSLVTAAAVAELPSTGDLGISRENASGVHDDEIVDERFAPLAVTLDDELEEGGDEALRTLKQKQRELIDSLPLDQ